MANQALPFDPAHAIRYAAPSRTIACEWIHDEPRRRWQWYLPASIVAALRERHA